MKKRKYFGLLLTILFALYSLTSCKSAETAAETTAVTQTQTAVSGTTTVPSGDFSGIILENVPAPGETAMTHTEQSAETVTATASETEQTDDTTSTAAETTGDNAPDIAIIDTTAPQTSASAAQQTTPAETTTAVTASSPDTTAGTVPASTATPAATTTRAAATSAQTTASSAAASTTTTAAQTTVSQTATSAGTTATAAPPSDYTGGSYAKNSYQALNHSYVKAMWISYIELGTFFGKDEAAFRSGFAAMMDNCASLGINTVYVHVRAFGDAYYYSDLFPFTKKMSGTLGKRTAYDPLKIMINEAHSRKISLHAWINPLRLGSTADMAATSGSLPVGKWYNGSENGKYVVGIGGNWYLNPAYPAVRKLIGDGVREIVSRYDVDGIHIDDYFYPTTDTSFDSAAFAAFGTGNLSTFRVNNINEMVKEMYTAAHECGTALFGAAPQGNNNNNLYVLYADTKGWCNGGYIDYFTPQVYYGFNNGGVPFKSNVNEWLALVKGTKTKLYIGLAVYKAGNEDKWAGAGKNEWQNTDTMLKRQTEYANEAGCSGIALYSYDYIFTAGKNTPAMTKEIENLKPLLV